MGRQSMRELKGWRDDLEMGWVALNKVFSKTKHLFCSVKIYRIET